MSGSGISWAICKSAPRSRQITTPAPHHSCFLQAGCPSCRPNNSVKALKAHYYIMGIICDVKDITRHVYEKLTAVLRDMSYWHKEINLLVIEFNFCNTRALILQCKSIIFRIKRHSSALRHCKNVVGKNTCKTSKHVADFHMTWDAVNGPCLDVSISDWEQTRCTCEHHYI